MAEYICRGDYSRLEFDLWASAEARAVRTPCSCMEANLRA